MLISAIQQHESTVSVHIPPPLWAYFPYPSHPSWSLRSAELSSRVTQQPPASCFTYGSVYMSVPLSLYPTLSFPCWVHKSLSSFQVCNTVLLTLVPMPYTHYVSVTYLFYDWKFVPFGYLHPFPPLPSPHIWQPQSVLCICEVLFSGEGSGFHVRSNGVYLSLSDLTSFRMGWMIFQCVCGRKKFATVW